MKFLDKRTSKFFVFKCISCVIPKSLLVSLITAITIVVSGCQAHHYWDFCDVYSHNELQTTLYDTNLYHNAYIANDRILLFNPSITNNFFLLENQKFGLHFNKLLINNSSLQYPIAITNDVADNFYILDNYREHRIRVNGIIFGDPKCKYRIYHFNPNNQELLLIAEITDTSAPLIDFYRDSAKIFYTDNQLYLMSMQNNGKHALFSITENQEPSLYVLHEFKYDILDIDSSQNNLLVLNKDGIIIRYELEDNQLKMAESFDLPKKLFKSSSNLSYRLLSSHHDRHYIVFSSQKNEKGQRIIKSLYVYKDGQLNKYNNIPSEIITFSKSQLTNNNPKESIFVISNSKGQIHKSLLKQTINPE